MYTCGYSSCYIYNNYNNIIQNINYIINQWLSG